MNLRYTFFGFILGIFLTMIGFSLYNNNKLGFKNKQTCNFEDLPKSELHGYDSMIFKYYHPEPYMSPHLLAVGENQRVIIDRNVAGNRAININKKFYYKWYRNCLESNIRGEKFIYYVSNRLENVIK